MEFTTEMWILIVTQISTLVGTIAVMKASIVHIRSDLKRLEKKQDTHNGLIERMVVVEESCKSAHHRLDTKEGVNRR